MWLVAVLWFGSGPATGPSMTASPIIAAMAIGANGNQDGPGWGCNPANRILATKKATENTNIMSLVLILLARRIPSTKQNGAGVNAAMHSTPSAEALRTPITTIRVANATFAPIEFAPNCGLAGIAEPLLVL